MSRKGENIYKRKDGRWEGRYLKRTPDGKSRYGYVYAATYREARAQLLRAAALWETAPKREPNEANLLAAVAERWEKNIAQQVKESTFVKYHSIITRHILPTLGQVSVEEMTHERIESAALQWLHEGGYWYWLDKQGRMLTGLQKINGRLYMLNPKRAHDVPTGACIYTDDQGAVRAK